MRIIHTGDWHLGRLFYGDHLTEDQAYVLEQEFLPYVKEYRPHCVIIAGDVYDRAVPPEEAVELWDMVTARIVGDYKIPMIVISGNHDSGRRLASGNALLERVGLHMVGSFMDRPIILDDTYGQVRFFPCAYEEPRPIYEALRARGYEGNPFGTDYHAAYRSWVEMMKPQLGQRNVAIAHAFVTGGATSESERTLMVGASGQMGADVFSPFQYTALGHLHRPQQVDSERIRYSGSLLPYSFSEVGYEKSFVALEMDQLGQITTELIPLHGQHGMAVLCGYFDDLMNDEHLHTAHYNDYVAVELLDEAPIIDGLARLRTVFPLVKSLELLTRRDKPKESEAAVLYRKLSAEDLLASFMVAARHEGLSEEEKVYVNDVWREVEEAMR